MKFGGTSVAGPERLKAVARRLVAAREAGNRVVGVLSAMGDTTDELVQLAHEVSHASRAARARHAHLGRRAHLVRARAMAIHDLGHEAISLTGSQAGIVTDTVARQGEDRRGARAAGSTRRSTQGGSCSSPASRASRPTLDITTLGRGGSDMTAVALAAALGADACEIYTDVEGVYTADPRIVPEARKLHAVSYEEMLEMAASGAKVLQLRSVEFARNHDVKLHVRSSFCRGRGHVDPEEDERMLEKAMISGVMHTLEELVYRVEGVGAGPLFDALAGAS